MIKFDLNINDEIYSKYKYKVKEALQTFELDSKMSDWYYIDKCISKEEIEAINKEKEYIRKNADVFVVIGIGGSYLGSKAVIEALSKEKNLKIIYAGISLSSSKLLEIINYIKNKKVVINVISKSGSTLETNVTFDILLEEMKKKYSNTELSKRIIITTDKENSTLLKVKEELNLKLFNVPRNIGGRFSVLTNVGLLPIAVMGIDIEELLNGAISASKEEDTIYRYALLRTLCYMNDRYIEAFTTYQEELTYFNEWLKQLFAESEGKNKKGILPISIINTRDLHSLGQYLQEGKEMAFETIIYAHEEDSINVKKYNKTLEEINYLAMQSVKESHKHMISNLIELDKLDEYNIGYLIYFFEKSCMLSSYLLDVNYYDQPGVNAYKEILLNKLNKDN